MSNLQGTAGVHRSRPICTEPGPITVTDVLTYRSRRRAA
jgi:hypothetical protein